jgi:hypothetical protein
VNSLRLLCVLETGDVPDGNLFAELLDDSDWEVLVRGGFVTPDAYKRVRRTRERVTVSEDEHKWLQREMRKAPTGPYARYLAGGRAPTGDECQETEKDGNN